MPRRAFHLAGYCLKVPGDASKTAENGSRFGSRSGKPVMLARGLAGIREPDDRLASPAKTGLLMTRLPGHGVRQSGQPHIRHGHSSDRRVTSGG